MKKEVQAALENEVEINRRLRAEIIAICEKYDKLSKQLIKERTSSSILQSRIAKRKVGIYTSLLSGLKGIERLSRIMTNFNEEDNEKRRNVRHR